MPRVTVLLSAYNDEPFLSAAIESVLAQTFTDFELLVLDDASTDRSRDVVARYRDPRLRLITHESNLGLGASLNRGLVLARGEYVARLDANDVAAPRRLEQQVACLDAHPEVAAVAGQATLIDVRGRTIGHLRRPVTDPGLRWWRIFGNPLIHSAMTYRRAVVWDELGGYPPVRFGEDFELITRLARSHAIRNLPETVLSVRIVSSSMSVTPRSPARDEYYRRKAPMIHQNLRDALQSDEVPLRWVEQWTDVIDAHRPQRDVGDAVRMIEQSAARFAALHGETPEVRLRQAWMLTRAFEKAPSPSVWLKIWRRDRATAFRALPRCAVPLWRAIQRRRAYSSQ